MLRNLFLTYLLIQLSFTVLLAQLSVSNSGALISVKNGGFVSVHGDYQSRFGGSIDNSDTVYLYGNWINQAGNTGFNNSGDGAVILLGDTQRIMGPDTTIFYDLELTGTGVKHGDVNVQVEGILQLHNRELRMTYNTVRVTNPKVDAVRNDTGFVSSLAAGGLERYTNRDTSYLFPVGSRLNGDYYRPVEIAPNTTAQQIYRVRFADTEPGQEFFDRSQREPTICWINDQYYHRIYRVQGDQPADLRFYFREPVDYEFTDIVHWQNIPQWEDVGQELYVPAVGGLQSTLEISQWDMFDEFAFALGNSSRPFELTVDDDNICQGDTVSILGDSVFISHEFYVNGDLVQDDSTYTYTDDGWAFNDSVTAIAQDTTCIAYSYPVAFPVYPLPEPDAGEDTTVFPGSVVQLQANGGMSYEWQPDTALSCIFCDNPEATVFETTPVVLIAGNEYDCFATDTVTIFTDEGIDAEDVIFIPNAITPNGDGANETWNIGNLYVYPDNEVQILNRWGDVLYSADPYQNEFDGKYNGKPVPEGTYYYLLKLNDIGQVLSGPLTIIR